MPEWNRRLGHGGRGPRRRGDADGTVDSRRTKRLAEDVALITTGVLDVQNALKIDPGFFGRMAERVREAVQGE